MSRTDGRRSDELRRVSITPDYLRHPEGSALIQVGETKVICTASFESKPPPWRRGTGKGWITSEYGMLPRATTERNSREASKGRPSGRTQEIQRLIGRSLRAVVDLAKLGECTIWIDCDVMDADGGTRTASICGAFVALVLALRALKDKGRIPAVPVRDFVAATSVGVVDGEALLDLNYAEDSRAEVDMNVVRTAGGRFVEIQGTAESSPFDHEELARLLTLADGGIRELVRQQVEVLGPVESLRAT